MATRENQNRTSQTRNSQAKTGQTRPSQGKKRKKSRKKSKIIIFILEIIIIAGMLAAVYLLRDFGKTGITRVEFTEDEIQMNEVVKDNEQMAGYRNIALFGVDSTSGALTKNTRSDSIIIASINQDTGEVRLVSVYRDTYLNLSNDKYAKCNGAYMYGGAKQAMAMLNMNLDLDITDFVTVGFEGLKETIDALGGIYIDVDSVERTHLNNYQITMAENLQCTQTPVEDTGYQLLDGLQAVAYCRVRYTKGDDFKRAERQREVIQAIIEKAKEADAQTLVDIANRVTEADAVYTSLDTKEILELVSSVGKYTIVDEAGFPADEYRGTAVLGSIGDSVLPLDLEKNVVWLHQFLFQDEDYQVSETVADFSQTIREKIAVYKPDLKYPN